MDKFIECVNTFLEDEFGEESRIDSMPEDGIIHLAFTEYTFEDGEDREIQVDFDVNRIAFLNYIDDELVLVEPRDSLDEAGEEIKWCSFDNIIYDCLNKGRELYG